MDQHRQIRFLIPPFFLLASLFWGDYLSCSNIITKIADQSDKTILAIVAALGASALPLGFLIGLGSITALRIWGLFSKKNYELAIDEDLLEKNIWPKLKTNLTFDHKFLFYAGVTFDHELITEGVHKWIARRWNSFYISINCCTALFLSHAFGFVFKINQTFWWVFSSFALILLLYFNGKKAWSDTMKMIEFQTYRNFETKLDE